MRVFGWIGQNDLEELWQSLVFVVGRSTGAIVVDRWHLLGVDVSRAASAARQPQQQGKRDGWIHLSLVSQATRGELTGG